MSVQQLSREILTTTILTSTSKERFPILKPRGQDVVWVGLDQNLLHKDMLPFIHMLTSAIGFAGGLKAYEPDRDSLFLEGGGSSLNGYSMVWGEYQNTVQLLNAMLDQIGKGGKLIISS